VDAHSAASDGRYRWLLQPTANTSTATLIENTSSVVCSGTYWAKPRAICGAGSHKASTRPKASNDRAHHAVRASGPWLG